MDSSLGLVSFLLVLMTTSLGCEVSKAESSLIPVQGIVTLDDRPASNGSVCYHPEDPAIGVLPVGSIRPDGTYQVYVHGRTGAPAGTYQVTIFIHERPSARAGHSGLPISMIDSRYNARQTTPLSIVVRRDAAPGQYDLKIVTNSRNGR